MEFRKYKCFMRFRCKVKDPQKLQDDLDRHDILSEIVIDSMINANQLSYIKKLELVVKDQDVLMVRMVSKESLSMGIKYDILQWVCDKLKELGSRYFKCGLYCIESDEKDSSLFMYDPSVRFSLCK